MMSESSNTPDIPPGAPRSWIGRLLRPVVTLAALVYFLIDALVYWIVRPFACWVGALPVFAGFARWLSGLAPYPALLVVLLPLVLLEPAKWAGAWLLASGQTTTGLVVLTVAELLKITLVERLFHLTRDRLMTIGWVAWILNRVSGWLVWFKDLPPCRAARRVAGRIKDTARTAAGAVRRWVGAVLG